MGDTFKGITANTGTVNIATRGSTITTNQDASSPSSSATSKKNPQGHQGPHKIFICYRRNDCPYVVGHIYERLVHEFGPAAIFKDLHSVEPGVDFQKITEDVLAKAAAVIVIIGPHWLSTTAEGMQRIHQQNDYVRLELIHSLKRKIPVIPLLVDNAELPAPSMLPEEIRPLVQRNAYRIRPDPDFKNDMDRLINGIKPLVTT